MSRISSEDEQHAGSALVQDKLYWCLFNKTESYIVIKNQLEHTDDPLTVGDPIIRFDNVAAVAAGTCIVSVFGTLIVIYQSKIDNTWVVNQQTDAGQLFNLVLPDTFQTAEKLTVLPNGLGTVAKNGGTVVAYDLVIRAENHQQMAPPQEVDWRFTRDEFIELQAPVIVSEVLKDSTILSCPSTVVQNESWSVQHFPGVDGFAIIKYMDNFVAQIKQEGLRRWVPLGIVCAWNRLVILFSADGGNECELRVYPIANHATGELKDAFKTQPTSRRVFVAERYKNSVGKNCKALHFEPQRSQLIVVKHSPSQNLFEVLQTTLWHNTVMREQYKEWRNAKLKADAGFRSMFMAVLLCNNWRRTKEHVDAVLPALPPEIINEILTPNYGATNLFLSAPFTDRCARALSRAQHLCP